MARPAASAEASPAPLRARERGCSWPGAAIEPLQALAAEITDAGGAAEVAVVDAFDEAAVDAHVGIGGRTGRLGRRVVQPDHAVATCKASR